MPKYRPLIFTREPVGSTFAETAFSTDTPTEPRPIVAGWAETDFSTDHETQPRFFGWAIVQDDWT